MICVEIINLVYFKIYQRNRIKFEVLRAERLKQLLTSADAKSGEKTAVICLKFEISSFLKQINAWYRRREKSFERSLY